MFHFVPGVPGKNGTLQSSVLSLLPRFIGVARSTGKQFDSLPFIYITTSNLQLIAPLYFVWRCQGS